jgi:hypothetical protein
LSSEIGTRCDWSVNERWRNIAAVDYTLLAFTHFFFQIPLSMSVCFRSILVAKRRLIPGLLGLNSTTALAQGNMDAGTILLYHSAVLAPSGVHRVGTSVIRATDRQGLLSARDINGYVGPQSGYCHRSRWGASHSEREKCDSVTTRVAYPVGSGETGTTGPPPTR